jgi:hypothetical protein
LIWSGRQGTPFEAWHLQELSRWKKVHTTANRSVRSTRRPSSPAVPQRLKPGTLLLPNGTTEVVPFHVSFLPGSCRCRRTYPLLAKGARKRGTRISSRCDGQRWRPAKSRFLTSFGMTRLKINSNGTSDGQECPSHKGLAERRRGQPPPRVAAHPNSRL